MFDILIRTLNRDQLIYHEIKLFEIICTIDYTSSLPVSPTSIASEMGNRFTTSKVTSVPITSPQTPAPTTTSAEPTTPPVESPQTTTTPPVAAPQTPRVLVESPQILQTPTLPQEIVNPQATPKISTPPVSEEKPETMNEIETFRVSYVRGLLTESEETPGVANKVAISAKVFAYITRFPEFLLEYRRFRETVYNKGLDLLQDKYLAEESSFISEEERLRVRNIISECLTVIKRLDKYDEKKEQGELFIVIPRRNPEVEEETEEEIDLPSQHDMEAVREEIEAPFEYDMEAVEKGFSEIRRRRQATQSNVL